jgi:hypothetical protein
MGRELGARQNHMRERIAQLAARLMAEDGIRDFASAKRKAARQVGAPDTKSLPSNAEVEQALISYQALYQQDEHPRHLNMLRQRALQIMHLFEQFDPHLAGPVLTGTAAKHSGIELQLFSDSVKEVELFLMNHQVPYKAGQRRFRFGEEMRIVPTFTLFVEGSSVEVAVFASMDRRMAPRDPVDGRSMERARSKQVEALVQEADKCP